MAINYLSGFNTGELSEKMNGRTDLDVYRNGCRRLENFYALPQGGVERRTGTRYIAQTKNNSKARLVPFSFSAAQSYAVEFGEQYARFYDKDGTVASDVVTPYSVDNVRDLQYAQRYDLLFLVNGVDPVQKLSRTTISPTFTFEELEWEYPPMLEENDTDVTITPSGTTGSVTLTASADTFVSDHVGSYWRIRHERTAAQQSITGSLGSTGAGASIDLSFSDWKLTTGGTWNGLVELQKSTDGGSTWDKLAIVGDTTGVTARNFQANSEMPEDKNTLLRIYFTRSIGTLEYNLYAESPYIEGLAKVTAYSSATSVTADVINTLASTDATKFWTEGAFSDYRGHPRTVLFHEDRLWFCGTDYEPATIYASVSGDYFNFLQGTLADSSIRRVPESPEPAEWMASKKQIFLGTAGGAMTIQSVDDRENINVDTISTPSQSEYGADYIQAVRTNDVVVYVQKNGRKLREMIYNWEEENFRSNDLTILSEQITESGIVENFLQKQPDQIIHGIKADGDIAALTYERPQEVVGWGRITTDGDFISGCALPSTEGEDEVFVCVLRNGEYNIEVFEPRADLEWYVDGGIKTSLIASQGLTGISKVVNKIEVTKAAHGLSDGFIVRFLDVGGMTELNEMVYTVADATASTFTLKSEDGSVYVDGTSYGDWTSGGTFAQVTNSVSGLSHLDGMGVQVVGDGSFIETTTVASGVASFDEWATEIIIGCPYESILQPMPLEPQLGDRLSNSRKKAVSKCSFKVYKTKGAQIGPENKRKAPLIARTTSDTAGSPIAVETGEHRLFIANGWKREKVIEISQNLPYPLSVLSMAVWVEVEGG